MVKSGGNKNGGNKSVKKSISTTPKKKARTKRSKARANKISPLPPSPSSSSSSSEDDELQQHPVERYEIYIMDRLGNPEYYFFVDKYDLPRQALEFLETCWDRDFMMKQFLLIRDTLAIEDRQETLKRYQRDDWDSFKNTQYQFATKWDIYNWMDYISNKIPTENMHFCTEHEVPPNTLLVKKYTAYKDDFMFSFTEQELEAVNIVNSPVATEENKKTEEKPTLIYVPNTPENVDLI